MEQQEILNKLKLTFTLNKLGGFCMGEGECFSLSNKELKNSDFDFFVKCVEKNGEYITTFIPNKNSVNMDNIDEWDDQEMVELFQNIITYKTTKDEIASSVIRINNSNSMWKFNTTEDEIIIDDMGFFYLCLYGKEISRLNVSIFY